MIDKINLFPTMQPGGYPQKQDAVERRAKKHQEEHRAIVESIKQSKEIADLAFEIYQKKAEQNRIRLEIFQNRKLDLYV